LGGKGAGVRLIRFYVSKHLLFQDLDLRFDRPGRLDTGKYALDFLVGVNGSGKSTLLRALMQVFSNLESNQPNSFDFELEYLLGEKETAQHVVIRRVTENNRTLQTMQVRSGEEIIYPESESIDGNYLPKNVIVYSSGNEAEWVRLLNDAQEDPGAEDASKDILDDSVLRSIKELPGSMVKKRFIETLDAPPPFWLMRSKNLPIMTLCGLLTHLTKYNDNLLSEALTALRVEKINGFSLRFRLHSTLSPDEDYKRLAKLATRHLRQGTDRLLYFDLVTRPNLTADLLKEYTNGFELYRRLEHITRPDETGQPTLQQINIFLQSTAQPVPEEETDGEESNTVPNLFLLDWLSDGEQSFLGRMALLVMLDTDDSLILLDEPEVHFNDYWKRDIVYLLDKVMSSHTNHLLITTHSSILLSDVTEENVTVLVKDSQGWSRKQFLRLPLLAVDPSEIMVNYFGTDRSVGKRSTQLLTDVVGRGNLEELEKYLNMVGPGYWRYRIQAKLEELRASSS
jgi:energy-coupling factor transporter ATP-binding protein EcfA2